MPAVTELMVAELLYLEKQGASQPIEMLINSSGTTRQDGEILAFDSEGIALTSTMGFIKNPISTVNMGLAVGWSCAVLAFGKKGWRKSLPHSLAMIQQPRVPPTGQRQAIEVHIKWREVLDYKREYLRMLSIGTGWPVEKLDQDMQRPLYMRPQDALAYNIIDEIIEPDGDKVNRATAYWVRSGRAESEGRLEEWYDYLALQEKYSLEDSARKAVAQEIRANFRNTAQRALSGTKTEQAAIEGLKQRLSSHQLEDDEVRLPISRKGIEVALLNAERYADRNVARHVKAGKVTVPQAWKEQSAKEQQEKEEAHRNQTDKGDIDYAALIRAIDNMDPEEFASADLDKLMNQYSTA